MIRVDALYPLFCANIGVGHTCLSLCGAMRGGGLDVRLTVPASEPTDPRDYVRNVVPGYLRSLSCRGRFRDMRHWWAERGFLRQLPPDSVTYIWPAVSTSVYDEIKRRGQVVVMERINCHRATSRRILDDAYERLGWPASHGITDLDIAEETRKLAAADYVFCPSAFVRQSMIEAGVSEDKLLPASYGWEPRRFTGEHRFLPPVDGMTVLFVGLVCVRKGVHLLLRAWAKAGIKGRLVLAGAIYPEIAEGCADELNRPDVLHVKKCPDVAAIYRSADAFAFPTLEEGSPLVSYETLAAGLPSIVSHMGAGSIIRDGREGIVRDAYDEEAWIHALQQLAADREYRQWLGANARLRAEEFTWEQAGRRRRRQLQQVLTSGQSALAETGAVLQA